MCVVIVSLLENIYQFSHLRYLSPKDGTNCLDVKLEQIRLILLRYCSKLCYYDNLLYNNKKKNKKKFNYINNIYVCVYIHIYIYIYIYIYKQLDTFLYKLKRRRVYTLS